MHRGQADAPGRPRHQHLTVLDRHPQRLECRAVELRQLVHEEHAAVREGDLARAQAGVADQGGREAV